MPSLLPLALTESHCRKHGWWLLLLLTALLYLPGLNNLPMMDRDEPRFAHATVEMMQRGSWAVPYFNGEYRFDKPPLTYWWMRLHYSLFGINEGAARLHSVIATWLVSLVILSLGRRLADARAGLVAGAAWLLSLQVLVHGRLCVADMPMVLCVALAMNALFILLEQPVTKFTRWHTVLYVALGLGFLAKGPIAWFIPALALLLHRWVFWRRSLSWASLHLGKGFLLSLGLVAAWGVPALIETQGLFWKVGMGEHVIARGTTAFNGRFPVPGYYFATALVSLFPWIALLPQIWSATRQRWTATTALLVSWMAAPYVIFSFYATQLAHYVMPGFPAAMILLGIVGFDKQGPRWHRWWTTIVISLIAAVAIAATIGSQRTGLPEPLRPLLLHGALLLAVHSFLALCIALRLHWKEKFQAAAIGLSILCLPLCIRALLQDLRDVHPAVQLVESIGPHSDKATLLAWQFTEPSLVFHFNHEWKYTNRLETVNKHLQRKSPTITVLLKREWTLSRALRDPLPEHDNTSTVDALIAAHPDLQVVTVSGFNGARSSWVELVALIKN